MAAYAWFTNLMQLASKLEPRSLGMVLIAIVALAAMAWIGAAMGKSSSQAGNVTIQLDAKGELPMLSRHEIAKQLGVSAGTLDNMVKRGEFPPPLRFGRNCVRWQKDTFDHWIAARAKAAAARK